MRRAVRLKKLKAKLKELTTKANLVAKKRIKEDGSVDYDSCVELNRINTDISLTRRMIDFSKHGKSYLGDCLGDSTPMVSEFD